jgi:hypothetical protein
MDTYNRRHKIEVIVDGIMPNILSTDRLVVCPSNRIKNDPTPSYITQF